MRAKTKLSPPPWAECPNCGGKLSLWGMRERFECPYCDRLLMSNAGKARASAVIACLAALPFAWVLGEWTVHALTEKPVEYADWKLVVVLVEFALFCAVFRSTLKVTSR